MNLQNQTKILTLKSDKIINKFHRSQNSNCSLNFMKVKVDDDIEYVFCGLNSFPVESIASKMTIEFHSRHNTYGGKFRCNLRTIEEECRCGWKNPVGKGDKIRI